jgi:hypothetical protein
MHIKKYKKISKIKIITSAIIMIALLGSVFIFLNRQASKVDQDNAAQKSKDEAQTNSAKSTDANGSSDKSNSSISSKTSEQVPDSSTVTVNIDRSSQADGLVSSIAVINNTSESGSCVFIYSTPDAKPVSREAKSTLIDTKNTCSIGIPEVEFNKLGLWNLTVYFYLNDQKSETTKDVTIN